MGLNQLIFYGKKKDGAELLCSPEAMTINHLYTTNSSDARDGEKKKKHLSLAARCL